MKNVSIVANLSIFFESEKRSTQNKCVSHFGGRLVIKNTEFDTKKKLHSRALLQPLLCNP